MPIVGPVQGSTGQPSFAGSPTTCLFGGLPLPNGQGVLGYINLDDTVNWFLQDISIDHSNRSVGIQPLVARAKSVYVSDDFLNKVITLRMWYREINNPIGYAEARLSQAGEQQLTFDNSTYILAKYQGMQTPKLLARYAPLLWEIDLEFICREPWFKDINSTVTSATTVIAAPAGVPGINFPTTAPSIAVGGYRGVARVESRGSSRTAATATARSSAPRAYMATRSWVPPSAVITTSGNSAASGGSMTVGTYTLAYTYVTASGETAASPATPGAPGWAQSDYVSARVDWRGGSRSSGFSGQQASMNNIGARSRTISRYGQSRIAPYSGAVTLTSGFQQISVGAVPFPAWATGVKWYIMSGPSGTTGFTVQNANGNAFTLNTIGNGVGPPTSTPATAFSITYAGSVWVAPQYTITIPASNPNSVVSMTLKNTMASETLSVTFPGTLPGGRAYTLTLDADAFTVTDQTGKAYDYSQSFVNLYGPAGMVNPLTLQLVGTPSDPVGVTISATYFNRWEG